MNLFIVYLEPAEEGGYIASVPALPALHTQGETKKEALAMTEDAIRRDIESLKKWGAAALDVKNRGRLVQGGINDMLYRYKVILEWDEEGKGYVVSVPALPGCFTQGDTIEEALERAKEAIAGHLAALAQEGLPLPSKDVEIAEVQVEIAS